MGDYGSAEAPTSEPSGHRRSRSSSASSASTTSIVFDRLQEQSEKDHIKPNRSRHGRNRYADSVVDDDPLKESETTDPETGPFLPDPAGGPDTRRGVDRGFKRLLWVLGGVFIAAWVVALVLFVTNKSDEHSTSADHDPADTASHKSGKPVTLDQVQEGFWRAASHSIEWIPGADGEDGLLLETDAEGKDFLVVEDVRSLSRQDAKTKKNADAGSSRTLIKQKTFTWNGQKFTISNAWPSSDLKRVLVSTQRQRNWRHSFTAVYWVVDVETQEAEPLDPDHPEARVQLATWSPESDAIAFTRDNNMYLRKLGSNPNANNKHKKQVMQITDDGGQEFFYGVPDWVYEEEVFSGNGATWWSDDGKHVAFLRTNETDVPEYPIQYFASRPSGEDPAPGQENYPEELRIKYPKVGSHNPVVDLMFYDVDGDETFQVDAGDDTFADDDRIINFVMWAGADKVLVKSTNRVSDVLKVFLVDVRERQSNVTRHVDFSEVDGGWFEISHATRFVPADPDNGRPDDGYVDRVVRDNGDHLAYFTPLDAGDDDAALTTKGKEWEVDQGPLAVDTDTNIVYFSATTPESSIQRHVYGVHLNGTGMRALTDTESEGYYDMSFSSGGQFGLLSCLGPKVPWQKVVSTPSNPDNGSYEVVIEENKDLAERAKKHALPLLEYGTITVGDDGDGGRGPVDVNYVERLPIHFDPDKKYPVLFQQYSGPGSQQVTKKFAVDFQSYVASALGYVVVTVDGRGTGFIGRDARVVVRDHLGRYEAADQIAAAREWASRPYVDASRIAIWGWSFGGFNALKTLEADAGRTFSYGMAVAPVTDWRFYDSVYTERYMRTPDVNDGGYDETAVTDAAALGANVRFLVMHGVADDNVHFQNSLALLDRLDLARVENYDVHVFPDSDHGIYFHNANRIVYDKLSNWLINAFNGEWLKISDAQPVVEDRDMEEKAKVEDRTESLGGLLLEKR